MIALKSYFTLYPQYVKIEMWIMKNPLVLEKNHPYHIIVRAVDRKTIFPTEEERTRFVVQMYAANIGSPGFNLHKRQVQEACGDIFIGKEPYSVVEKKHNPLVSFFSFALVGNHYHFGLIGHFDNAISKYLQKLNTGFAKFFNAKHGRIGSLFETRFRAIPVENSRQLAALTRYISIKNVLDVYDPKWAERPSIDVNTAAAFINDYRYSSFQDLFSSRSSLIMPASNFSYLQEVLGEEFLQYRKNAFGQISDVLTSKGIDMEYNIHVE